MYRKNIIKYAELVVTSNVNIHDAVTWPRVFRVYESSSPAYFVDTRGLAAPGR